MEDNYTIHEVFDFTTGKHKKSEEFFKHFEDFSGDEKILKKVEFRSKLEDARKGYFNQSPIFGCWYCHSLVVLRAISPKNKYKQHFKAKHAEDCIIKTKKSLNQDEILRIKFNGQQEGREHIELKNKIEHFLELNKYNKHQVLDIRNDKRHRLTTDENSKEWRKPDIYTIIQINERKINIAIELQLATTFIEVVKERQDFYKRDNSYIIWIFNDFSTNIDELKMTHIDVFVANSKNAFVMNSETIIESEKRNDLVLLCIYRKYERVGKEIKCDWANKLITLDELTFTEDYKAFYHDSIAEYTDLLLELEKESIIQLTEPAKSKISEKINLIEIQKGFSDANENRKVVFDNQKTEDGDDDYKIDEIIKSLKKFYQDKQSDLSFYWEKQINNLSGNSIIKLNNILRFSTEYKEKFVKKLIFENSHNNFLKFILENKNILLDLDITNNGITAFEKIIGETELRKIEKIIESFFRNSYEIKQQDILYIQNKFPCNDISNENFTKNYIINLMVKLNTLDYFYKLDNLHFQSIIWALLSVKHNQNIYWNHENYRASANLVFSKFPEFGDIYIRCLSVFKKLDKMFDEDKKGNFRKNYNNFKNSKPKQDTEHTEILKIIIPEIVD